MDPVDYTYTKQLAAACACTMMRELQQDIHLPFDEKGEVRAQSKSWMVGLGGFGLLLGH